MHKEIGRRDVINTDDATFKSQKRTILGTSGQGTRSTICSSFNFFKCIRGLMKMMTNDKEIDLDKYFLQCFLKEHVDTISNNIQLFNLFVLQYFLNNHNLLNINLKAELAKLGFQFTSMKYNLCFDKVYSIYLVKKVKA